MTRHPAHLRDKIKTLRSQGKTYGEINQEIKMSLSKSTLSHICKAVKLPASYSSRIEKLNFNSLNKARIIAHEMTRIKREEFFKRIESINAPISELVHDKNTAKIALAMLCLGEASKYSNERRGFSLGNSDPRIIILFLKLLEMCFENFDLSRVRCSVQCRADQNTQDLEKYWRVVTGVPKKLFCKPLVDPRTVGKPTLKPNYKGVLRVYYFDTKVHLELESLAQLIYNQVSLGR